MQKPSDVLPAPWSIKKIESCILLRETIMPHHQQDGTIDPLQEQESKAHHIGYQKGLEQSQKFINDIVAKYQQAIIQLDRCRHDVLKILETEVVQLALHIAKQVVKIDTTAREAFAASMVKKALDIFEETDAIVLRISPTDIQSVLNAYPELKDSTRVHLVEDATLEIGGIVAECNMGRLNANLQDKLALITKDMIT